MKSMKRNSILPILVLTSIMGISSCSTDYMAYDVGLKDGIYFITDSVNYQFGMKVGEDFNYAIAVRLLGTPKHYDRKFGIELLEEETTAKEGLHYKLIDTFVIPADMVIGKVSFILHRYLDPEITKRAFVVKMRLVENENFRLVMNDECKLEFSDTELPRPRWWSERHFGPYSQMLRMDILNNYWALEETHPLLFERIAAEYGRNLERAYSFPYQQEIAFIKYIITPAYEYYKEHPHPKVDIPEPATLV